MSNEEEDTAEAGKFAARYPLWVLYRESQRTKAPDSHGVVPFRQPGVGNEAGPVLLIFTSEQGAIAFVQAVPVEDLQPLAVGDSKVLFTLCKYFKVNGCVSIAVDYSLADGGASFYNIEEVMRDILNGKHDR